MFLINQYFKLDIFKFKILLFFLSISFKAFGTNILGFDFFTNISTLIIYVIFILQLFSTKFKIHKILIFLYFTIFIYSFILNYNTFVFSIFYKHYINLIIYSFTIFSFLFEYKFKLSSFIEYYFKYTFYLSLIGIVQFFYFIFFHKSFIPHLIISYGSFSHNYSFKPEIFNYFPRIIGLSSEPAHYATLLLPSIFIIILRNLNFEKISIKFNKSYSFFIIIAFILSFSLVGFISIFIFLIYIYFKFYSRNKLSIYKISSFLFLTLFFISQINFSKISRIKFMLFEFSNFKYTTSDLSGFAIISNFFVTKSALINSFFLGRGFNTHIISYDQYLYNHFNLNNVILELNKSDAGSMYLRILSEFGIIGFYFSIYFLIKHNIKYNRNNSVFFIYNQISIIFILCYALRNGDYLNIVFWFFVSIFYFSFENDLIYGN